MALWTVKKALDYIEKNGIKPNKSYNTYRKGTATEAHYYNLPGVENVDTLDKVGTITYSVEVVNGIGSYLHTSQDLRTRFLCIGGPFNTMRKTPEEAGSEYTLFNRAHRFRDGSIVSVALLHNSWFTTL